MSRVRATLRPLSAVLFAVGALVASSCGGSGGDDGPPPLVFVAFPAGGSFTESASVRVRGTSAGAALSAVTVAGVPAASADGFQTWSAVVPLVEGDNAIPVVATDAEGNPDPSAPTLHVRRGLCMGRPASLDLDAAGNRLLVLDAFVRRLTLLDLGTGAHTLVSGSGRGTGTAFSRPEAAVFDLPRGRALVADSDLDAVFAVDLATGNRTFLTGQGAGSGTALNTPEGLALDLAGNRLLLVDSTLDAVVAVNLTTGARSVLSDGATGTGTAFSLPTEIVHDAAGNRVFVRDPSVRVLFVVALSSGNRTVLASGGAYNQSGGIALDLPGNRMLATDAGFDRVVATDLTTAVETTLSDDADDGTPLAGPSSILHDAANGRVLVGQGGHERILEVDLSSGDRGTLFDLPLGGGPRFDGPDAVALELARGRLLVADEVIRIGGEIGAVLAVDLRSGVRIAEPFNRPVAIRLDAPRDRVLLYSSTGGRITEMDLDDADTSLLAGGGVGSGESLQFCSDLCYDVAAARFLLSVGSPVSGLLAADEATGDRTIFANAGVGSGESTSGAIAVECDPTGAQVYYGTNSAGTIARVAVATGVRTRVTSDAAGGGTGPSVGAMQAIRLDAAQNRLLVFAGITDAIIAVDLATGNRTELSGPNVGQGVPVSSVGAGDVDLDHQVAAFPDRLMEWLVLVDLQTGDRVGFSR